MVHARGVKSGASRSRPWLAIVGGFGGVLVTAVFISATAYLVFRDSLPVQQPLVDDGIARFAYDDRLAEIREEIDRLTSRPVIDNSAIENAVQRLLGRQATLDARQDLIVDLKAMAKRAGIDFTAPVPPSPAAIAVPATVDATLITGGIQPTAALSTDPPLTTLVLRGNSEPTPAAAPPSVEDQLTVATTSLDDIERQQIAFVRAVSGNLANRTLQITSVIEGLGQKVPMRTPKRALREGGPYVPAAPDANAVAFRDGITAIADGISTFQAAREAARTLPLSRPVTTEATSSGFGERSDPFLGYAAMHEGIDFLAEFGAPVTATAPGVVTAAGPNGGYGNMVEIDHGNNIVTRYGHLSQILVKTGTKVSAGMVVGKVGSTGRSTGPHLHYEVRVKERAINPGPFLRAGGTLRSVL
ncbi:MAG: M23 family metallopeptidase [Bauldia sp.]